jgi:hypothetical protein
MIDEYHNWPLAGVVLGELAEAVNVNGAQLLATCVAPFGSTVEFNS